METPAPAGNSGGHKGKAGLVIAVVVLAGMAIAFRLYFLIILAIGIAVAAILYLWNKYRPIKEEDVDNKHPLGLK
jgi:hypothetical protein